MFVELNTIRTKCFKTLVLIFCWTFITLLMACQTMYKAEQACDQFLFLCGDQLPTDLIETSRGTCVKSLEASADDTLNECLIKSATCEDIIACGYTANL